MKYFSGNVFEYSSSGAIAFSNIIFSTKTIILLGGLGDNICSVKISEKLIQFCNKNKIRLIIPQLESQPNFTIYPIQKDIENIHELISNLENTQIVLIGHSTGCQDSLLYLKAHPETKVHGIILQAPVSDVEFMENIEPALSKFIDKAKFSRFIEYKDRIYLSERFLSLYQRNGTEDLFSSYLDDKNFENFKNNCQIFSVLSGKDEFCIKSVEDKLSIFGDVEIIEEADHSLSREADQSRFISILENFLSGINFLNK